MVKITEEDRELFGKKVEAYKEIITGILQKEKDALALMEGEPDGVGYKKIALCEDMIRLSTLYNAINGFSLGMLGRNDPEALNESRKALYRAVIYLEETVSNYIDCPYSDYEDRVAQISGVAIAQRYLLVRKLGLAIRLLIDAYGDNTKWKWAFVELNGRFAAVAKNLADLKAATKTYFDPNEKDYETTVNYIRLIKTLISQSADKYRDRYEMSTRRIDDIRLGINYLLALRRLYILTGDSEEAEEIKKKAQIWNTRMEADKKKGEST
ncbi:MAG: hypothetical protein LBR23_01475 [Spirochaetaceae bacterium]|jgi:hypothetical protein|nr:hypothetical protein [Spirochaetaceae bacterium]